jgi:VIT1/CCC1 family predicted Fe2+/Mn2+ transporter
MSLMFDTRKDIRPSLMGAQDGIVTTGAVVVALLSTGHSPETVRTAAIASAVAGATSMALAEWTAVSGQRDANGGVWVQDPVRAAVVSWCSFMIGSILPIASLYIRIPDESRVLAALFMSALAMAIIGGVTGYLSNGDMFSNAKRMAFGGSLAIFLATLAGRYS